MSILCKWVGKIPGRRERLPTTVFWPGEFHGKNSLADYSPWGLQREGYDWVTNTLTRHLLHWRNPLCLSLESASPCTALGAQNTTQMKPRSLLSCAYVLRAGRQTTHRYRDQEPGTWVVMGPQRHVRQVSGQTEGNRGQEVLSEKMTQEQRPKAREGQEASRVHFY